VNSSTSFNPIQSVRQQDVHSLTACSWDHFESKSSTKHASGLQLFAKKMLRTHYAFAMFEKSVH
jgi:hypothetical protein